MSINPKLAIGGSMMALVIAGGVYASTAFAQQSPTPAPTNTPSPSASSGSNFNGQQDFINHLASRLNLQPSQVQDAMKNAAKDVVADAQAAGKVTSAQATQIDQRIDSGKGGPGFGGFGLGPRPGGPAGPNGKPGARGGGPQVLAAAAKALNITPQQLMQQLRSGQTLQAIAGNNWSQVQQAMISAVNADNNLSATQKQNIIDRINSGNFPGRPGPRPNRGASPQ